MENIRISVIMSIFNEEFEWVKLSVQSILNQTYENIEFLIVIDNPENIEVIELLNNLASLDNRIKLIFNSINRGLIYSLNKAIKYSNGEYIARMDADDISFLDRLEKQKKFLDLNNEIDILGANINCINENGKVILKNVLQKYDEKILIKMLYCKNVMVHPTLMYRRKVIEKLKGYENATYAEDYEFLIRATINNFKIFNLDEVLLNYRIRENGITKKNTNYQLATTLYIQKKYKEYKKIGNYNFNEAELLEIHKEETLKSEIKNLINANKYKRIYSYLINNKYKNIMNNNIKIRILETVNKFKLR